MTALLSRSMDERLPRWERCAAGLHLVYCRACRRYKQQLRIVRAALRRAGAEIQDAAGATQAAGGPAAAETVDALSADARARIRDVLERGS